MTFKKFSYAGRRQNCLVASVFPMCQQKVLHVTDRAGLTGIGLLQDALLYSITIQYFRGSTELTKSPIVFVTSWMDLYLECGSMVLTGTKKLIALCFFLKKTRILGWYKLPVLSAWPVYFSISSQSPWSWSAHRHAYCRT